MNCFKAVVRLGAHLITPVEIEKEKALFKKELCLEEVDQCQADIDKYWPGKKKVVAIVNLVHHLRPFTKMTFL
jgi:hypothetical protein